MSKISYPRKCEFCSYISNNAPMFSYHKKTHEEIPHGTLCWQNCENPARYRNTNGKYICVQKTHNCPEYIKEHSKRIKEHWQRPNNEIRREQSKINMYQFNHVPEVRKRQKETIQKNSILKPEDAKNYKSYSGKCHSLGQKWAKENGYELGRTTFHVDHKFSVLESFYAGLHISIVNHPANLQILSAKENSGKGPRCSITLNELLNEINKGEIV